MMARYDRTFSRKAVRALELASGDLREAFERATDLGISAEAFEQFLLNDLMNDGPIFGKFKSNLMGGAESGVMTAHQQGVTVGEAYELGFMDDLDEQERKALLDGTDPELMQAQEDEIADFVEYTWVATLVNTCPFCVALHGKTMTKIQWRDQGLDPQTVHADHGINAQCYCRLVVSDAARRDPLATEKPLRRAQVDGRKGTKGNRKTERVLLGDDPENALTAAKKLQKTEDGKKTLRAMGNSAPEEIASAVRAARAEARADRGQ